MLIRWYRQVLQLAYDRTATRYNCWVMYLVAVLDGDEVDEAVITAVKVHLVPLYVRQTLCHPYLTYCRV